MVCFVSRSLGDDLVSPALCETGTAGALVDRLVRHAEVINLKGDSYRFKGRDLGRWPLMSADRGCSDYVDGVLALTGASRRGSRTHMWLITANGRAVKS